VSPGASQRNPVILNSNEKQQHKKTTDAETIMAGCGLEANITRSDIDQPHG
jgi:hypothetical protein